MTEGRTRIPLRDRHEMCRDPELQPMILRLGLALGDINAKGITRADVASLVAATVAARKAAR